MRSHALFLSGILLTTSCATVTNLGSHGLEDNPSVFATLRISGYFTVTHFDDKNVSWRGASWAAQACTWNRPDDKYAEVRIGPGRHDLQFDLHRCSQRSLQPLHISYKFHAGRTYLLAAKFEEIGSWSTTFSIKPEITVVADDISVPRQGTGYTVIGGTVYDAKTKLAWQQTVSSTLYSWADAKTYCAGVGTTLGGEGWRLPTIQELTTLVDSTQSHPSIDPTAFPSTPSESFWSSSLLAGSPSKASAVHFDSGQTYTFDASLAGYVRCVR
jgi:hypothetical protein